MKLNLKYLKGFFGYKFFDGKALLPSSISFNLTSKCNLRCKFCWQYGAKGIFQRESLLVSDEEMRLDDLKMIVDDISGSLRNVTIWGGEPMLHPGFAQFSRYIKNKDIYLNIITNGTLLAKFAETLVEIKADSLVVSIDGPGEVHDRVRGVEGSYQKITEGIKRINELKRSSGKNLPGVHANFTISDSNFNMISGSLAEFEKLDITSVIISHLWFTDKNTYDKNEEVFKAEFNSNSPYFRGFLRDISGIDLKVLESEIRNVKNIKWKIPVSFLPDLSSKEILEYYRNPGNSLRFKSCLVPWVTACVLPNGDLTPCSDRPDFIVGNLKEKSFNQLWNNERFRLYRKTLKQERLFPMCSRCCELFRQ